MDDSTAKHSPASELEARAARGRSGEVVGDKYELIRRIGEGGMAEVYEARHRFLDRRVAIKVLLREHIKREQLVRRFVREAKAQSVLESEHVVEVSDFGETDDGSPYIVMEYLEGSDLRHLLRAKPPPSTGRVLAILLDACRGVALAHSHGLVHRDLKPENLFVVERQEGDECCKVLDFGVAKTEDAESLTRDGGLVGTVRYMAPEQARGKREVDGRIDVFALGTILYECLAGKPAFEGEKSEIVLFQILNNHYEPLASLRPDLPAELVGVVERAMAPDPDERYQSVGELALAISAVRLADSARLLRDTSARTTTSGDSTVVESARAQDLPNVGEAKRPWWLGRYGLALSAAVFFSAGWLGRSLNGDPRSTQPRRDVSAAKRPVPATSDVPEDSTSATRNEAAKPARLEPVAAPPDSKGPTASSQTSRVSGSAASSSKTTGEEAPAAAQRMRNQKPRPKVPARSTNNSDWLDPNPYD